MGDNNYIEKYMEIKTLIVGYKPLIENGEKHKSSEIRADNYFKEFLKKFDLGELHFCGFTGYKEIIDQLNPILCIVFGENYAEEISGYKKGIILYVTYSPSEIFWRKKEQEGRIKEQEATFKEIESLLKKIKDEGHKEEDVRKFASMDYKDWYEMIKQSFLSEKPDLISKAWNLLTNNEGPSMFKWMKVNFLLDCWNASDGKGKEEFLTMAMEQHIENGSAREINIFTEADGIKYRQYMFTYPDGSDSNYIRRIPIANDMEKSEYESLLYKYETPTGVQMMMEAGQVKELWEKHKSGYNRPTRMKKLLLTSDGFVNPRIGKRFIELIGKDPKNIRVLFIPTAAQGEVEMSYVHESEKELVNLGIPKESIVWANDLKSAHTEYCDAIYVCGGNTFYLMDEIRKTGFDKKIIDFINSGKVYVGVSAGSIIMCPDISISAPFDPNNVGLKDMAGLNITDKVITPHYQRKEKEMIDNWEKSHSYEVVRLNDGEAMEVSDNGGNIIQ